MDNFDISKVYMSSPENPTEAVLLATYNGEKYIIEQLESIRNQTYSNFKCYIHDDGSKDGTCRLLEEYCSQNPENFKLVEGLPCGGSKNNFFFLLSSITDESYIMFCDQDDYWLPEKIEISLKTLQEEEQEKDEPICVYSDMEVVNSSLETIDSSYYHYSGADPYKNDLKSLLMTNVVAGCTMMINRALADKGSAEVPHELLYMHDWWLALLASAFGKVIYIDKPLLKYRQHMNNVLGAYQKKRTMKRLMDFITFKNWKKNRSIMQMSVNFSKALDMVLDESDYKGLIHEMSEINEHSWFYQARFFVSKGLIPINKFWRIFYL